MIPHFHGHTCAKCETEMKALPVVVGAWPTFYFCPNEKCERGGVLVVNVKEAQE